MRPRRGGEGPPDGAAAAAWRAAGGTRGAALIEALVAAAILALALLPLGQSLSMALQAVRAGGLHLRAAAVAETAVEQSRREAALDFAAFVDSGTRVTAEEGFEVRRTVSLPPGVPPGTALVEISLRDTDRPLLRLRFLVHPEGF